MSLDGGVSNKSKMYTPTSLHPELCKIDTLKNEFMFYKRVMKNEVIKYHMYNFI